MSFVVEDGTIVANANSYATVADCITWLTCLGYTPMPTDAELQVLLIKGTLYIDSLESCMKGSQTSPGVQCLAYPRTGVCIGTYEVDANTIPKQLKTALFAAVAVQHFEGINLMPNVAAASSSTSAAGAVVEETVGPLTIKYSDGNTVATGGGSSPRLPLVMSSLSPLLSAGKYGAGGYQSMRV